MTNKLSVKVKVNSERPDFRVFGTYFFGNDFYNFDSEGNNFFVSSRDWTELYMKSRQNKDLWFDISWIDKENTSILEVTSDKIENVNIIAYFLAKETNGEIFDDTDKPILLDTLKNKMGNFDLKARLLLAEQSIWRKSSETNQYPNIENTQSNFNFFRTTIPRKADFYLGCLDGSVFMDFIQSNENLISLCRISFDGYGCCNLKSTTNYLSLELSTQFLEEILKEEIDQHKMIRIVKEIIKRNKEFIWTDALEKYNLLDEE